jgi:phospholipase/carboxylesterase
MTMTDTYQFAEVAAPAGAPLLVLLHGTGGGEQSFVQLGRRLMPGAHLVAPRGDVSEGGALRFFRRTGEGVYDMADLARATTKLTAFLEAQRQRLGAGEVFALGYSNGANILASVLFSAPQTIDRAVLMHPLIPFAPAPQPGLAGKKVLLTAGRRDPISPAPLTEQLAQYFAANGAETSLTWHDGGHEARPEEFAAAEVFLRG